MNILITGITGFAGSHLAELIRDKGISADDFLEYKIFGLRHWRSRLDNVKDLLETGAIELIECDLKDQSAVARAIEISKPTWIFHLAAHSYVPTSWKMPSEVAINNIVGEINLFEAVRNMLPKSKTRIHIAGSSEEYGLVKPSEVPIKETNSFKPLSTYGVSKLAQDFLGYQYWKSYGLHIVRTRAFNHTGPRRGEVFVCSTFAKQIAEIEAGLREPIIKVGNLEAIRDFTDVRDMVRAYWLALEKGRAGDVYNIGSGRMLTMKDVLDILLEMAKVKVRIAVDPDRLRPSDVPILLCDNTKFMKKTGWTPQIKFKETLSDLLNYWRERVGIQHSMDK